MNARLTTKTTNTQNHLRLWSSILLLTVVAPVYPQEHIASSDSYNPGIYYTFTEFITNSPVDRREVIFDQEKRKLYYKDTGKRVKAQRVYGFCDGEQVYLAMKKFNPVEKVDRYTYFTEKGFELGMIFVFGPSSVAIPFPIWYHREYMANLNNGNTYYANKKTLKMVLESDATLYSEYMNDKKRKKRYQYYLEAYNDRNRKELKSLSELRDTKPELFQIENKYNKNKRLPN